jgi:hypothetical protein
MTTRYLEEHIVKVLAVMPDLTSADIAVKLDAPVNSVKNALTLMREKGRATWQRVGKARLWRLLDEPPEKPVAPYVKPERINKMDGTYDGKELRRNPGIPDERYAAFNLPSLMGGERVTPRRTA